MERIGLLGGTFDPPHWGHLWLAENGRETLKLDRVLLLPAGRPPHKRAAPTATAAQRSEMVALAAEGQAAFELSDLDWRRPEPHYTATLLPRVVEEFAAAEMWLLLGSDSLRDFAGWHRPESILEQARLAVLPRPGAAVNWAMLSARLPRIDGRVTYLPGPSLDISGRAIRAGLAAGHSVRYLLPPAVEAFIRAHQLYVAAGAANS